MRIQNKILLLSVVALYSCASKSQNTNAIQQTTDSAQTSLFNPSDEFSYIGFVNRYYFQETDEFYVDLYFKKSSFSDKEYYQIVASGDSTLYKDEENQRKRIPVAVAEAAFDLSGLKILSLFDESHKFLAHAHFVRVEYLDQNISPVFTAVYKADKPSVVYKAQYCIGNLSAEITANNYTSFEDTTLATDISQKMGYAHQFTFEGKHYHIKNSQSSISVINLDTTVVIIEQKKNRYECLYKSKVAENIYDIVFIPIILNNRPIILTKSIVPETDIEWNDILVFDGKQYKRANRQRIKQ